MVMVDPSGLILRPVASGPDNARLASSPEVDNGATNPVGRRRYGNGCGPGGWKETIIPDRTFFFDFRDACEGHDLCYGTWGTRKPDCDVQFRNACLRACVRYLIPFINPPWRAPACSASALAYYRAVKHFGNAAFRSAQLDVCPLPTRARCDANIARRLG
jgi:hypothetical protein